MEIVGHGVSQKDQLTEAFVKRLEEKSWESPQK